MMEGTRSIFKFIKHENRPASTNKQITEKKAEYESDRESLSSSSRTGSFSCEAESMDNDISEEWIESIMTTYYLFVENVRYDPCIHIHSFNVRKLGVQDGTRDICEVNLNHRLGDDDIHSHLIVKKTFQECSLALRETKFYTQILPVLNQIPAVEPLQVSICYHAQHLPGYSTTLVIENLEHKGYSRIPSLLDAENIKPCLCFLADLHARGVYLSKQNNETNSKKENRFKTSTNQTKQFSTNSLQRLMKTGNEILDERKERALLNLQSAKEVVLSESQLQTVLRAEEYIHSTPLTTIQSTEPDTFNTVSHGRFSNNAVLYKQKDGEVSCAVIDWQEVCFQSLTIDVSTCIYSNLSEEDFREYEDDLLVYYIETFNQFLHPLLHYQDQIKILDLEVFRREQKINKFSIILSIVGLNGWLEDECKRERILKYLETIDS